MQFSLVFQPATPTATVSPPPAVYVEALDQTIYKVRRNCGRRGEETNWAEEKGGGVREAEALGIAIQFVYVAILSVCVRLVYDLMEQYSKRLDRVVFQFYLLSPVKFNSFAKGCT